MLNTGGMSSSLVAIVKLSICATGKFGKFDKGRLPYILPYNSKKFVKYLSNLENTV